MARKKNPIKPVKAGKPPTGSGVPKPVPKQKPPTGGDTKPAVRPSYSALQKAGVNSKLGRQAARNIATKRGVSMAAAAGIERSHLRKGQGVAGFQGGTARGINAKVQPYTAGQPGNNLGHDANKNKPGVGQFKPETTTNPGDNLGHDAQRVKPKVGDLHPEQSSSPRASQSKPMVATPVASTSPTTQSVGSAPSMAGARGTTGDTFTPATKMRPGHTPLKATGLQAMPKRLSSSDY